MRCPIGLSPGKYFSANFRLTMATGWVSRVSLRLKVRPDVQRNMQGVKISAGYRKLYCALELARRYRAIFDPEIVVLSVLAVGECGGDFRVSHAR